MMSCCIPTTSTSHTCVWNMSGILSNFSRFYITLPTVGVPWSPNETGSLGWRRKTGTVPRHMVDGVAVKELKSTHYNKETLLSTIDSYHGKYS